MGGCLACLTCEALCCAGNAFMCCGRLIPNSVTSRFGYVVQFLLVSLLAFISLEFGSDLLSWIPVINDCNDSNYCLGVVSVMRIMFGLTVFHAILSILMIGCQSTGDPRDQIQKSWWGIKLIILLVFIVLCFFIPDEFFVYYNWVALFGAGFFVLIQLVLLVDFSYCWAESWVTKATEDEESGKIWYCGIVTSAFTMFIGSLAASILLYVYFAYTGDCYYNILFITINIICAIIFTFVSITEKVQDANPKVGLLQSGVVTAYSTYLVSSAMMSEPSETCNPSYTGNDLASMSDLDIFFLVLGSVITIFAVCFSTVSAATSSSQLSSKQETLLVKADEEIVESSEVTEVAYNYTFFHFAFALAAMYMCQLLTNWNTLQHQTSGYQITDFGWTSVFIKMGSSWLVILLYLWSLLAPVLFPDREWYT
eukprot:TRINITY_DN4035_c0_g1_i1.p1 TRINITY_DN4035_c0_g1~~TRINITY_DN4035_c0_g1_i1.p1  ORF type:complete len:424 (-),score=38.44 TRINITY_DN4035_c0_g1_i1:89-1360(-)